MTDKTKRIWQGLGAGFAMVVLAMVGGGGASMLANPGGASASTDLSAYATKAEVAATNGFVGIHHANPTEVLCVSGNVSIVGSRQVNGIWQGNYLGVYTNANPTTVVPQRQMDYYLDTGSNTVVWNVGGTTNTWRWTPLNSF